MKNSENTESSILANPPSHVVDQCPVCAFTKFSVVHTKGALYGRNSATVCVRSVYCHNCGVVYLNPRLSDEILSAFYESEQSALHQFNSNSLKMNPISELTRLRLDKVKAILGEGSHVLEIGGGASQLAYQLACSDPTVNISAIEPSVPQDLQVLPNFRIVKAFFDDAYVLESKVKYDLIIANHVLEHQSQPVVFLEQMRTVLRPTGKVVLEVPDLFAPYWALPRLDQFFRTVHLLTFSRHSIFRLMSAAGYGVVSLDCDAVHSIRVVAEPISGREMIPKGNSHSLIKVKCYFSLWKSYSRISDISGLGWVSFVFSRVVYRCMRMQKE